MKEQILNIDKCDEDCEESSESCNDCNSHSDESSDQDDSNQVSKKAINSTGINDDSISIEENNDN